MRRWTVAIATLPLVLAGCGGAESGGSADDPKAGAGSATTRDPAYVAARVTTGAKPCGILGVDDRLWVSNYADDDLVSVDPLTGAVGDPVPTGHEPCGLASGAGSIWVEDFGS